MMMTHINIEMYLHGSDWISKGTNSEPLEKWKLNRAISDNWVPDQYLDTLPYVLQDLYASEFCPSQFWYYIWYC